MRRLVGWIGGALGGLTAYRLLRRRPQAAPTGPDTRAEELREKLAESRAAEPVVEEPETPAEPMAEEERPDEPEAESPEERRRRVHEEGRAALDEMRPE